MQNFLIEFVLAHVIKQQFMADYRSYFAGAGSIFAGLSVLVYVLATGDYDKEKVGAGVTALIAGYKIIGDAGKKDKLIAAERAKVAIAAQALAVDEAKGDVK